MGEDHPKRRSDLSIQTVEDETIVLDHAAKQIHQLNTTASFIWQRCDGQHTVRDIADELTRAFDIDRDAAHDAVMGSLRQFNDLGLLHADRD
jgi:coenzyme PQQ synthesis protein D (PqqD)